MQARAEAEKPPTHSPTDPSSSIFASAGFPDTVATHRKTEAPTHYTSITTYIHMIYQHDLWTDLVRLGQVRVPPEGGPARGAKRCVLEYIFDDHTEDWSAAADDHDSK